METVKPRLPFCGVTNSMLQVKKRADSSWRRNSRTRPAYCTVPFGSRAVRCLLHSSRFLAIRGIRGLFPWLIPPTLRMLTDGGLALSRAARHGAFLVGHWIARKPRPVRT